MAAAFHCLALEHTLDQASLCSNLNTQAHHSEKAGTGQIRFGAWTTAEIINSEFTALKSQSNIDAFMNKFWCYLLSNISFPLKLRSTQMPNKSAAFLPVRPNTKSIPICFILFDFLNSFSQFHQSSNMKDPNYIIPALIWKVRTITAWKGVKKHT